MDFLQNSFVQPAPNSEHWLDLNHEKGSYQKSPGTSEEKIKLICLNSLIDYMCRDPPNQEISKSPTELNTSFSKSLQFTEVINDTSSKPCNHNIISEDTGLSAERNSIDLIDLEHSAVSYFSELLSYHGHCQVLSIQELFEYKLNGSSTIQKISGSDIFQFINFLMRYPDHFLLTNNCVIGKKKLIKLSNAENKKFSDPIFTSIFYFVKSYTKNEAVFDTDKLYKDVGRCFLYSDRAPIFKCKDDLISFLCEYPNVFYADSKRVINLICSCKKARFYFRSGYCHSTAWFSDCEIKNNMENDIEQQPQVDVICSDTLEVPSHTNKSNFKDMFEPTLEAKIMYWSTMLSPTPTECSQHDIEQADTNVVHGNTIEDTSSIIEKKIDKNGDMINDYEPAQVIKIDYLQTIESSESTECFSLDIEQQIQADTNVLSGDSYKETLLIKNNNEKDEINIQEAKIDCMQTIESSESTECFSFDIEQLIQANTNVLAGDSFEETSHTKNNNEKDESKINIQKTKIDHLKTLESSKNTECFPFDIEQQLQAGTSIRSGDSFAQTLLTKNSNEMDENTINIQEAKIDCLQTMESSKNTDFFPFDIEHLQADTNVLGGDSFEETSTFKKNIENKTNIKESRIDYLQEFESTKSTECFSFDIEQQLQAGTSIRSGDSFAETLLTKNSNEMDLNTINIQEAKIDCLQTMESSESTECFSFDIEQLIQANTNVLAGDSFEETSHTKNNNVKDESKINIQKTKIDHLKTLESSKNTECFPFDIEQQLQAGTSIRSGDSFAETLLTKNSKEMDENTINIQEAKIDCLQTMESSKNTEFFPFDIEHLQADTNVLGGDSFEETSTFKKNIENKTNIKESRIDYLQDFESTKSTECFSFDIEQQLQAGTSIRSGDSFAETLLTKNSNEMDSITINIQEAKIDCLQTMESSESTECFSFDIEQQIQVDTNVLSGDSYKETSRTKNNNEKDESKINLQETEIDHLKTLESSKNTEFFPFDIEHLQADINVLAGDSFEETSHTKNNNVKDESKINIQKTKIDHLKTLESSKNTECFPFDIEQQLQAGTSIRSGDSFAETLLTKNSNEMDENTINIQEAKIDCLQTMESSKNTEFFPFDIEQLIQVDTNVLSGDSYKETLRTKNINEKDESKINLQETEIDHLKTLESSKNTEFFPFDIEHFQADTNVLGSDSFEETTTFKKNIEYKTNIQETKIDYWQTSKSTKSTECFPFDIEQQLQAGTSIRSGDSFAQTLLTKNSNEMDENTINIQEAKIDCLQTMESSKNTDFFPFDIEHLQADTNVLGGDSFEETSTFKKNIENKTNIKESRIDYLQEFESTKSTECFSFDIEQQLQAGTSIRSGDSFAETLLTKNSNEMDLNTINIQEAKIDCLQTMESSESTECFSFDIEQLIQANTNVLAGDSFEETSHTKNNNVKDESKINIQKTKIDHLKTLESSKNTECFPFDIEQQLQAGTSIRSGDSFAETLLTKNSKEMDENTINIQEAKIDCLQTMESSKNTEFFPFDIEHLQADTNVLGGDSFEETSTFKKNIENKTNIKESRIDYLQDFESTKSTECFSFDIEQQLQAGTSIRSGDSFAETLLTKNSNEMDSITINIQEAKIDCLQTMESSESTECFSFDIEQQIQVDTNVLSGDSYKETSRTKNNNEKDESKINLQETEIDHLKTLESSKNTEFFPFDIEHLQADINVLAGDSFEETSHTKNNNVKDESKINIQKTKIDHLKTLESSKNTECFPFDIEQQLQAGTSIRSGDSFAETLLTKNSNEMDENTINIQEAKIDCLQTMESSKNTEFFPFDIEQLIQVDTNVLSGDSYKETLRTKNINEKDESKINLQETEIDHLKTLESSKNTEFFPFDIEHFQADTNVLGSDSFEETTTFKKNIEYKTNIQETKIDYWQTSKSTKSTECFPFDIEQQLQAGTSIRSGDSFAETLLTKNNNEMDENTINIQEVKIDCLQTMESSESTECFSFDIEQQIQVDTNVLSGDSYKETSRTKNNNEKDESKINLQETEIDHLKTLESSKNTEFFPFDIEHLQADTNVLGGDSFEETSHTKNNNEKDETTINIQEAKIDCMQSMESSESTECFSFDIGQLIQANTNVLAGDSFEETSHTKNKNEKDESKINIQKTKIDHLKTLESSKNTEFFPFDIEHLQADTNVLGGDSFEETSHTKNSNEKDETTINIQEPKIACLQTLESSKRTENFSFDIEQLQADTNVLYGDTSDNILPTLEFNNIYRPIIKTNIGYFQTIDSPKIACGIVQHPLLEGTNALCCDSLDVTSPTNGSYYKSIDSMSILEPALETKINYWTTMELPKHTECLAFDSEQPKADSNFLFHHSLDNTFSNDSNQLIIIPQTNWSHIWDMDKIDNPAIDRKINNLQTITDHLQTTSELSKIKQCFPFDRQQQVQVGLNASCREMFKQPLYIEKNMSIIKPLTSNFNICDLGYKDKLETEMNHLRDTQMFELPKCIDSLPLPKEQQQSNLILPIGFTSNNTLSIEKKETAVKPRLPVSDIYGKVNISEPTIDTKIDHLLTITEHLQTKLPKCIESFKCNECFVFDADNHLSADLCLSSGGTFEDSMSIEKNLSIINPVASNSNFMNSDTTNSHDPTPDSKINNLPATYNHLEMNKTPKCIEQYSLSVERQADKLVSFGFTSDDTSPIEKNLAVSRPKLLMSNVWDKNCEHSIDTKINHLLTITDHLQTKLPTPESTNRAEGFSFDTDNDHLSTDLSFSSGDTFEDTLPAGGNMSIIKPVTSESNIWNLNAVNIHESTLKTKMDHDPATSNQLEIIESPKSIEFGSKPQQADLNVSFGNALEDTVAIEKKETTINPETTNYNFWDSHESTFDTGINYLPAVESFAGDACNVFEVEQQIHADSNISYDDISEKDKRHKQFQNIHCRKFNQTSMGENENSILAQSDVNLDNDIGNQESIVLQSNENLVSPFEGLKEKDFEKSTEKALIFLNSKLWEGDELHILKIDELFKFLSESLVITQYCSTLEDFKEFISMFQDDFIVSNNHVMARKNKINRSLNIVEECVPIMLYHFFDMYTQQNESISVKLLYERVGQHFYNINHTKIFKFSEQLKLFLEMFPDLFYIDNNHVINLTSTRKSANASLEGSKCDGSVDSSVEHKKINTFLETDPSLHWKDLVLKRTQLVEHKNDCRRITEAILKSEKIIAVDCEGVNLGSTGTLSLIQVGLESGDVYIFDVFKDKTMVIDGGLKEILESDSIVKVIHDCRNDAANLFTEYGIEISKVFDTRVVHHLIVNSGVKNYKQLNNFIAIGLNELCALYGAPINIEKDKMKGVYKSNPMFWNERPLTNVMLAYATLDVACLVPQLSDRLYFMIELKGIQEKLIWELSFKHSKSGL